MQASTNRLAQLRRLLALLSLPVVALAQPQTTPPPAASRNYTVLLESAQRDQPNWTRNFRIGMQVALNIKADFNLDGTFSVSGSNPGPAGVGGVDRFYDDGYVRVDDTGNAGGYTSFWGYNQASQIQNGQVILSGTTSYTTSGGGAAEDEAFFGFEMAYGAKLKRWGRMTLGWEFGFGLLPIEIAESQVLNGQFARTVHAFDTAGVIMPDAPYQGPFSSGGSPTIKDVPTALPSEVVPGTINGSRGFDLILYSFRLGPTLHWQFNARWGAMISAGGALGLLAGDYVYSEILQPDSGGETTNRGSLSGTEVVYGGYASGTLFFRTHEPADIYLTFQYMNLGEASFSGQGRAASLQLSDGVYLGVGINWPF